MATEVTVTLVHEEYAARLGKAGIDRDAARIDAIMAEIAQAGLEAALSVLTVQTRNLVWMLLLLRGPEESAKLFDTTILEAGKAVDDDA